MSSATPVALVLAAGKGERVGGDVPKQLLPLLGRPVVMHALTQHCRLGHRVVAVASAESRPDIEGLVQRHLAGADVTVVNGGATRRESVQAAVAAVPADSDDQTAIILRNAASPNTPDAVIVSCVEGLRDADGMQAYLRSEETTFVHDGSVLDQLIPRASTGFACDPTVYRHGILAAIAAAMAAGDPGETTLDIARSLGARIGLVVSPRSNIKVTTAADLARVAAAMES